jgi:hypothetical protein
MDKTEPSTTEILLQEAMNKIISLKIDNEIMSVKLEVFEKMIAFQNHAANKNIVQYAVSDAPLPVELRIERHLNELRNPPKPPMPDPAAEQPVKLTEEQFEEAFLMFFNRFNNCVKFVHDDFPGETFWMDKESNKMMLAHDSNHPKIIKISYAFWAEFQKKFHPDPEKLITLLAPIIKFAFNGNNAYPVLLLPDYPTEQVEEAFKKQSEPEKSE